MLATLDLDALVTAPEIQSHPGLKRQRVCRHTIASWVATGKLSPRGRRGRSPLYRLGDVLQVEAAARRQRRYSHRTDVCRSCLRVAERS